MDKMSGFFSMGQSGEALSQVLRPTQATLWSEVSTSRGAWDELSLKRISVGRSVYFGLASGTEINCCCKESRTNPLQHHPGTGTAA